MPGLAAVTTPALRASLGTPPGLGEDARLHGALEPSEKFGSSALSTKGLS